MAALLHWHELLQKSRGWALQNVVGHLCCLHQHCVRVDSCGLVTRASGDAMMGALWYTKSADGMWWQAAAGKSGHKPEGPPACYAAGGGSVRVLVRELCPWKLHFHHWLLLT